MRPLQILLGLAALGIGLVANVLVAQEPVQDHRADQLRAGYLINFMKFVEWPPASGSVGGTVCFIGGEGVRSAINESQATRKPGTPSITTRALSKDSPVTGCGVLYVEAESFAGTRSFPTDGLPILSVSDAHDFIYHGGVIELFSDGNHLRFKINLDNARRAGLRISSSLLQLASHVEESSR